VSETAETATRVVLSYDPAGIDEVSRFWVEDELGSDDVAERLRDGHGTLAEGGAEIGDVTAIDVRRQD
jgi:hypothetical protein